MDAKRRTVFFLLLLIAVISWTAPLPDLGVVDLYGKQVTLPRFHDVVTILVVGFSQTAGGQVAVWADHLDADLGAKSGYEVDRVAVLEEVPPLFRPLALAAIKNGVPVESRGRFFTTVRDAQAWKSVVGFHERDVAYLVLVDRKGEVQKTVAGSFDRQLYESTVAAAVALSPGP